MKITTKEVRDTTRIVEEIIEHYKEETEEKKRDWKTYEQRLAGRMKTAIRELEPIINEAISSLHIHKSETRGRTSKLTLKQKVILLLLKKLFSKSNREMEAMIALFSLLSDIDVSYKTIERLYSDEEVILVLYNIHILILQRKNIKNVDCSGDGTGYSLTIKKHYATEAQKLKEKLKTNPKRAKNKKQVLVYSFKLMDIKDRIYIAYGTSLKSEREAYDNAIKMAKELGINIKKIRLDKYYSAQLYVKELTTYFAGIETLMIPKKDATIKGPWNWKYMLYNFVTDPIGFLADYFARNQSESGFSEDKRRFGWKIMQRREDRIDTADFCIMIWHNLFWLG